MSSASPSALFYQHRSEPSRKTDRFPLMQMLLQILQNRIRSLPLFSDLRLFHSYFRPLFLFSEIAPVNGDNRRILLLFQDSSVRRNGHYLPWNEFSTVLQCFFRSHLNSSTARHFHTCYCNRFDVIVFDNFCQLFRIVHII